ncbi:MAG: sodium:solute symporter [Planctomycetes bacterium]|nr:sodium:solute symporter [Planctomycetota bacterium]
MTLGPVDWAIVLVLLAVLTYAALKTRRYAQNVSGFLAANRCAGRYLISVAFNMAQLGVITLVWYFQQNYDVGWTSIWWGLMEGPAMIVIALTGWVIYRFRRTRALTLAQFFEMRYSRRFRIFAGLVAFLSGIINYGIFPGVAARYFVALCGLPERVDLGFGSVPTFATLMVVLMAMALAFVFAGGQIAIMVTDFLQGVFAHAVFLVVIAFLLITIPWSHYQDVLLGRVWQGQWVLDTGVTASGAAPPAGQSLIHPFRLGNEANFNPLYWVISVVVLFYGMRAWQGDQGYNAAARTPHEARMANILNGWRFRVLMLITIVLPVAIRVMLHHPAYASAAEAARGALDGSATWLTSGYDQAPTDALRSELRIPAGTAVLLPAGLLGLMAAAMLGAFISTNDTYLHSWAAIFVQDVVLPFRKRPLSTRAHLRLLRLSVFGVAIFAVLFSLWYEPNQYIAMFLALTGAVFVGGAGSAIIGGLYWRRGTCAAAWTAMIVGMSLSGVGILVKDATVGAWLGENTASWWGAIARWLHGVHTDKYVTGQVLTLIAILAAVTSYVLVSLLGKRTDFDLDRLLHRGRYAVDEDRVTEHAGSSGFWAKLGFTREFSGRDRWVTWITLSWPLAWTVVFVVVTAWNLTHDVPATSWLAFWHVWTWAILAVGAAIVTWFSIGGFRDLRAMFRRLREIRADERDDGRVEH